MTPLGTADGLERLAVALLIGLLIGLDRERAEVRKAREMFAGVRTFPLIALAGCIPMLVIERTGPWLLVAVFAAIAAIEMLAYRRAAEEGHVGATTEAAGLAAFLLGVLAGAGYLLLAGAGGVVVAVLLVAKPRLEAFSLALSTEELAAVLELAVITVIVLPLLPNRGYGPWSVLNPREIWMVVVLVAGLSFAGFVAVRLLGERRGLAITGAVGGLVSSTAVTMAMADRSKENTALEHPAAAAAVLASTVMAARVAVFAGAVDTGILPRLLPAVAAMLVVGAVGSWLLARRGAKEIVRAGERIRNPFSLREAALFAGIYGLMLVAARAGGEYLGSGGMFATAAVGSAADVDAVTIAFTRIGAASAAWRDPAAAISLAMVVNTFVKLALAWTRGAPVFRRDMAMALTAMAAAGLVAGAAVFVWA
jgi:uncharacterized membrane protein (DUF4010 family)